MTIKGIDVSSYQAETFSTAGLSFCFVKATEGTHYENPKQHAQASHARKAGLIVGFYHFVRPGNMKAQAKYFAERCASREGDPLWLDWEDSGVTCTDKDTFIKEVIRLRGKTHRVGLYCNTNFWLNRDTTSYAGDALWIAQYGVGAGKPGIKHAWVIHQYTDRPVDTNVARFSSKAAMREWCDKGVSQSQPETPGESHGDAPPRSETAGPSQADKILKLAKSEVGYREGRNNWTKYPPQVPSLEWAQNQPWCATWVSWLALKTGLASLYPRTASCAAGVAWFKSRGRFSDYPAVGAQVFYGSGGGTHTGIVYGYDATNVFTYEGNTNNNGSANGDGVYKRTRRRRDSHIYGYGYPDFSAGIVTADPNPKWKRASATGDDMPNYLCVTRPEDFRVAPGVKDSVEFTREYADDASDHYMPDGSQVVIGPAVVQGDAWLEIEGLTPGAKAHVHLEHLNRKTNKYDRLGGVSTHIGTDGTTYVSHHFTDDVATDHGVRLRLIHYGAEPVTVRYVALKACVWAR